MQDFEKLGVFYLGREQDPANNTLKDNLILYDSRDLITHAVCVGMTGSGKTGLCISILEEAAIDGIPSIIIDPKGDMTNLLLTFPDLTADEFLPWINEDDARKKGLSPGEYAGQQADLWGKGLLEWGQDSARIQRLKNAADFVIYTPGSSAGIPLSILKSFQKPETAIVQDNDLLRERINTTVMSLLNLIGIEADPIQSREHILLSTILDMTWRQGQDLDLARFIQAVQSPPVNKIGVFDLESFFPSRDRFALAMKINNLLAAPGFQSWIEGNPLDIDQLLYTPQGKPRVSIVSIAHLNDPERMFIVSLLLTQLLGWMRSQSGTSSLRALLYMDEIYGYIPPVANPPSKPPLMTLLKQARAFGLGIVLATQNPVDLDYKGLSNTGTWFIGRLQTERDTERVLDGLQGTGSGEGGRFDRRKMAELISGLGKRVFLMNNIHEDAPVTFQTRWVMSYLRGPLTRNQIKQLMDPVRAAGPVTARPVGEPASSVTHPAVQTPSRPILPPRIPEYFIPLRKQPPADSVLHYEPALLGMATLYYASAKAGTAVERPVSLLAEFSLRSTAVRWDEAQGVELRETDLETAPEDNARFGELPEQAVQPGNYSAWTKEFKDWLYRNQTLNLLKSASLSFVSAPDETERDFRLRLQLAAREKRDALVERIRQKYASRIRTLEERIRRAGQAVDREKEQAKQQKLQTVMSFGATILSAILGRKATSLSSMDRAATAARGAGRILKESKDVHRAEENVQELQRQLEELQSLIHEETRAVSAAIDPLNEELKPVAIRPRKSDIAISFVALAWTPYWQDSRGRFLAAW